MHACVCSQHARTHQPVAARWLGYMYSLLSPVQQQQQQQQWWLMSGCDCYNAQHLSSSMHLSLFRGWQAVHKHTACSLAHCARWKQLPASHLPKQKSSSAHLMQAQHSKAQDTQKQDEAVQCCPLFASTCTLHLDLLLQLVLTVVVMVVVAACCSTAPQLCASLTRHREQVTLTRVHEWPMHGHSWLQCKVDARCQSKVH